MKIAYIANSVIPSSAANSIQAMKMCQAFKQRQVDIILIIPDVKGLIAKEGVFHFYVINERFEILRVPFMRGMGRDTIFAYKAVKLVKHKNVDLIYTRNLKVGYWSSFFGIPFIVELHHMHLTVMDKISLRFLVNSSKLKKIVVITNLLKERLLKQGLPQNKIAVFPDAVDIERFPHTEYFLPQKDKKLRIGYCGHLYKGRGIDIILEIAKKLSEYDFVITGGNKEDIKYWKHRARVIDNVFFKGFIPHSDVAKFLESTDILVMPHQRKAAASGGRINIAEFTSPLKMFEYMACGKPIIASDLPVLREVLKDKTNSILVPPDSTGEWVKAIEFLIANPDVARNIGINAREEVKEKYTWKKRVEKILDMIGENLPVILIVDLITSLWLQWLK